MTAAAYATEALASGKGRDGHIEVPDLGWDFPMATPKELGGSGNGTNPEQLFAAGFAACFHSALTSVAQWKKLDPGDSSVGAGVSLVPDDISYHFELELEVVLPGLNRADAEYLTEATLKACPFAKAIRDNVKMEVNIVEGEGPEDDDEE